MDIEKKNFAISPRILELLEKRGVGKDDRQAFLSPDYEAHTHSALLFANMDVAVARIANAINEGERIAIYADYDCDGIPGAVILWDFFAKIGYVNVEVYLPHRDREGYGLHIAALDTLRAHGVSIIITVDVGTTAVEPVAYALSIGVDVIVTDHHEVGGHELPKAVAVLNPKIKPYPFTELCGAAMAFKFVQGCLETWRNDAAAVPQSITLPMVGWEKWLLDMVAIATISDMVPLRGENRVLAFWGLKVLRKSDRPGIDALCLITKAVKGAITEEDIGFSFGPRLNAASRMDDPMLAFRILSTRDPREAQLLAASLDALNTKRKGMVASISREAKKRAKARYTTEKVAVIGDPEWKPSLVGLAANSLLEERGGGIVCVWGRDANGALKGSCRSDGEVSIVEMFAKAPACFTAYGGHAGSGGFTLAENAVHTLQEELEKAYQELAGIPREKKEATADLLVALSEIKFPLYRELSQLAPYGIENTKPLLRVPRARIISVRRFGKEKNHTELSLACGESGAEARAFQYFSAPEDFSVIPEASMLVDILGTIERDTYRGQTSVALRIVDIFKS